MNKIISAVVAAALGASSLVTGAGDAAARDRHRDRGHHNHYSDRQSYVRDYCGRNPRARDCNDWRRNGKRWDNNRYQTFYRHNHGNDNDVALAALFGIAIGAAVGSAANNNSYSNGGSHERLCASNYRTYDPRSDTYLAVDGYRYRCPL